MFQSDGWLLISPDKEYMLCSFPIQQWYVIKRCGARFYTDKEKPNFGLEAHPLYIPPSIYTSLIYIKSQYTTPVIINKFLFGHSVKGSIGERKFYKVIDR